MMTPEFHGEQNAEKDIWQFNGEVVEDEKTLGGRQYGFNRSKTGIMGTMHESFPWACDIKEPEEKTLSQARAERLADEEKRFDSLHFELDSLDEKKPDGQIRAILENKINYDEDVNFTEEQQEILSKLPDRTYLMDKNDELRCMLGLVDLIYAYAYTNRVNEGDWSSERGWTVAKLSATLSHFEEFTSMKAVKLCCIRRTLVFPLMRTCALAEVCWQDAIEIFKQGTARVLNCLLQIYQAFGTAAHGRHLLNDLYVRDFCIWLQAQCKSSRLQDIAKKMLETEVQKDELGLKIPSLEMDLDEFEENQVEDPQESEQALHSDDAASDSANSDDESVWESFNESGSFDEWNDIDDWGRFEELPDAFGPNEPSWLPATLRNL